MTLHNHAEKEGVDESKARSASLSARDKPADTTKDAKSSNAFNHKRSVSIAATYQVLERTNIQEKSLLNIEPLLSEFNRISVEFTRKILDIEDLTSHERLPCFSNLKEIMTLKANKRNNF